MILLFPFHPGDFNQAEAWMRWTAEIGAGKNHQIILMPAKAVVNFDSIRETAIRAFQSMDVLQDAEGIVGHPEGPNSCMRQAIWHMQMANLGPWTFMEPDCILLAPDALDVWEREYRSYGKPFMGEFRPAHDVTPDYLSGNMVLPKDALLLAPMLSRRGLSRDGVELAFDIVAASQTLPQAHLTKLLQQVPKTENGGGATFPDQESLSRIRPSAVMFHPCKDGTLIERLRERESGITKEKSESPELAAAVERLSKPMPYPNNPEQELSVALQRISELENLIVVHGIPERTCNPYGPHSEESKRWAALRAEKLNPKHIENDKKAAVSEKLKAAWVKRKQKSAKKAERAARKKVTA